MWKWSLEFRKVKITGYGVNLTGGARYCNYANFVLYGDE